MTNKHLSLPPSRRWLALLCVLTLLAHQAQAVLSYWDPQGTWGSYATYTAGSLAGTWENLSWSRNASGGAGAPADQGQASPVAFTESDAAVFAVGAGATNAGTASSTTAFTVTVNNNHTVAGFFNGALNPNSAVVTLTGPGIITIAGTAGTLQGFNMNNSSDSSTGWLIISNTLAGVAVLTPEGNGQIFLRGKNSWTGGVSLGYSGSSWSGIVNFNSVASFGTGPIKLLRGYSGSAGALVAEGSSAITITNNLDCSGALSNTPFLNMVGNPAGVTFSGPINLGSKAVNLGSGGAANLIILSGVISGTGSYTKYNTGTTELTAAETYTGATTVNNGILQLGDGATKTCTLATSGLTTTSPGTLLIKNPSAVTWSKVIGGNGTLTNASSAIQTFSAANTYSGGTAINTGSTTKLGNNGGVPNGELDLSGTLDLAGFSPTVKSLNGAGLITNSTGTGIYTFTAGSGNTSGNFNVTISPGSGIVALTQTGTGTLTLGGTSSYNGATTVTGGGTLLYNSAGAIAPLSSLLVQSGSTVDFGTVGGGTVAALGGSGSFNSINTTLTVNGNSATVTTQNFQGFSCIAGSLSGSGSLVKAGTHAMAFHPNAGSASPFATYSGTFSFNGGPLSVGGGANMLPSTYALTVPSGGLLQLDGASQTVASLNGSGAVNLAGGTLTVSGGGTYNGVIQNSELPGSSTATGNGLRGYYYTNIDLTGLSAVRDDSTVNFADMSFWPGYSASSKTNQVSVRWVGQVLTTVSGQYYFGTRCDDGSRLWVNGQLVVDNWVPQGVATKMGPAGGIFLLANTRYDVLLEYFNNTSAGAAGLQWAPPNLLGGNDPTNAVPANYLFLPNAGNLVVSGGALQLTVPSTYSGGSLVSGGTLEAIAPGALGTGNVSVGAGATLSLDSSAGINAAADLLVDASATAVNLNFTGTDNIHALSLDGGATFQAAGTYGSLTSSAAHKLAIFSGNGILNVGATGTTTTLNASNPTPTYGTPITLSSTVSGTGTPTGTVSFYDNGNWIGSSALVAGAASLSVSNLQVGFAHALTAVYSGDTTHASSTSAVATVNTSAETLTPTIIIVTKIYDGTTTATIGSLAGTLPTDSNYVYAANGYTATFATKDTGTQSVSVNGLSLAGSLSGNYTLSSSTFTTTGTITPKALKVFNITASAKVYDTTTAATINVANAALGVAESVGTGTTADGTNYIGDDVSVVTTGAVGNFADPNVANNKTVTITGLTLSGAQAGDYTVTAPTTTANITKDTSLDNFTSTPNPSSQGSPVSFTATLTGVNGGIPTGSVIFAAGNVPFSTNAIVSGVASTSYAGLPVGTTTVNAWYTGSTNFLAVTNSLSQVVNQSCSSTNALLSITKGVGNSYTLNFLGTASAQYYVLSQTNLAQPLSNWKIEAGSTNTADGTGHWSFTATNPAPAFYRSKAITVCP